MWHSLSMSTHTGGRRHRPGNPHPSSASSSSHSSSSLRSFVARSMRVHRAGGTATLALQPERHYTFGRGNAADVLFEESRVSRQHASLRFDDGRWLFVDLGSANGSFLCRAADMKKGVSDDETLPVRSVQAGEVIALQPGDAVLLGTRRAWVELCEDLPEGALHARTQARTIVSRAAQAFDEQIHTAAHSRLPVFLLGPSGAGKTQAARELHLRAQRDGAFVAINCARLPRNVTALHSELLGHVQGAFTGATHARRGRFFEAADGTLFLDEVESLPDVAQGFLLDLLDRTGDLLPLGASTPKAARPEVRLVSASKAPLAKSGLRADLCERLAEGHLILVPRLEERREDIPGLIAVFLEELREESGVDATLTDEAIRFTLDQPWPGQIRQLRAAIRALVQTGQAALLRQGGERRRVVVREQDFRTRMAERSAAFHPPLTEVGAPILDDDEPKTQEFHRNSFLSERPVNPRSLTREDLIAALATAGGNRTLAATQLGIARNTLLAKMRKFGVDDKGGGETT